MIATAMAGRDSGRIMRRRGVLKQVMIAGALALALGGCQSSKNPFDPDKPLDKMTKEEWCSFYAYYLTNPAISNETRANATRQMRARSCPQAPA